MANHSVHRLKFSSEHIHLIKSLLIYPRDQVFAHSFILIAFKVSVFEIHSYKYFQCTHLIIGSIFHFQSL